MITNTNYKRKEDIKMDKDLHIKIFKLMVRARLFEERQLQLYHEAKIRGYLHPGIGNEATEAAIITAVRDEDIIYPTHRGHGLFAMRGADMGKVLAELMGKSNGYCSGQAGSCHLAAPQVRQVQGILGAQIPIATGEALAIKLLGEIKVVLCTFGDGAANNGTFHEGLNMASIWKLPVVFVCVNNLYAVSFSFNNSTSVKSNAIRAKGYSMPGYDIDGSDYEKAYRTIKAAVDRARDGEGPTLIEAKTTRVKGHHPNDSGSYRSKEELEAVKKKDPIRKATRKLLRLKILGRSEINRIYHEVKKDIEKAVAYADNSPFPSIDEFVKYCRQTLE